MFKSRQQLPANHVISFRDVSKDANLYFTTDQDLTSLMLVAGGTAQTRYSLVIAPALDRLIQMGQAGLLIDSSQMLADLSSEKYKQHSVLIGTSDGCKPVNLLDALSHEGVRALLTNAEEGIDQGAVNDALLVLSYLRAATTPSPTLADLYDALIDASQTVTSINRFVQKTRTLPEIFVSELNINLCDPAGLMNAHKTATPSGNRLLPLLSMLSPFANDTLIRNKFCAQHKHFPFKKVILDLRKTICMDMPESLFGHSSRLVSCALITAYKEMLTAKAHVGYDGVLKKSFLILDDAADYLTSQDVSWLGQSQRHGSMVLLGSASLGALRQPLGNAATTLLSHVQSKIVLPTEDEYTLAWLHKHEMDLGIFREANSEKICFVHKCSFPQISGVHTLELTEPVINARNGTHHLDAGSRVNTRYQAATHAWYVIGDESAISTSMLLEEVKERLSRSIQDPQKLLSAITLIPLAGKPGLGTFKAALHQAFAAPADHRHLVFVAAEAEKSFAQALNMPELVKTIHGLLDAGHMDDLHLAVHPQHAGLLLEDSGQRLLLSDLVTRVAQALSTGVDQ